MWMWLIAAIAAAPANGPPEVARVMAPRDAVTAALVDLGRHVRRERQPFAWYVWNNVGTEQSAAAINFTVNAVISQATTIVQPMRVAEGWLLRYDLQELLPRRGDLQRARDVFQELAAFEPYFHQPTAGKELRRVKVRVTPYLASDGRWYDYIWQRRLVRRQAEFGVHAGGAGPLRLLSDLLGRNPLPIVRGDWLIATAWSSVDVGGIRGRYYELAGIKANPRGQTAFDAFLRSVGADPKRVEELRADQRAAMISGVTGKWRRVDAFFAIGTRPESGPSLVTITHDITDDETDATRHPLLNLLEFEDQAREIIAAKPNGLHLFVLTDGDGNLQDEAPPDVAAWPASPHTTKRLVAGIACVQCHGAGGGYNPVRNYVRELYRRGFAPVLDIAAKSGLADTLDRLRGLYDGDFDLPLKQAADGYAAAVDRATWGTFGPRAVQGASAAVFDIYRDYFARVTPVKLLRELGYEVDEEHAIETLSRIVPPVKDEDGRIGAIRLGLPILRGDLHEVYYEVALRDVLRAGDDDGWHRDGRGLWPLRAQPLPTPAPRVQPRAVHPKTLHRSVVEKDRLLEVPIDRSFRVTYHVIFPPPAVGGTTGFTYSPVAYSFLDPALFVNAASRYLDTAQLAADKGFGEFNQSAALVLEQQAIIAQLQARRDVLQQVAKVLADTPPQLQAGRDANGALRIERAAVLEPRARVREIITNHCIRCHGLDRQEAGLDLSNLDVVDTSLEAKILDRITTADPAKRMPKGDTLSAEEITAFFRAGSLSGRTGD